MAAFLTASARGIRLSALRVASTPRTTSLNISRIVKRNMTDSSKTKSESEWRAVLNKEQVSSNPPSHHNRALTYAPTYHHSSAFSARKALSLQAPASTTSSTRKECTAVPGVARLCTRVPPSLTAAVDGLPSLTVCDLCLVVDLD